MFAARDLVDPTTRDNLLRMSSERPSIVEVNWTTLIRELFVTTLGILLALGLNAWWGRRQDRAREQVYLRQLAADVDRTLAPENLPAAVEQEDRAARATVTLLRAFRAVTPPPSDSVVRWLYDAESFRSFTPLTGTARALIDGHDIALIRNDSLRALIIAMVALIDENAIRVHDYQLKWQAQAEALEQNTDYIALKTRVLGPVATDSAARTDASFELPQGPRREPFAATDYRALLHNQDVYRALVKMNTAHRNTLEILRRELDGLRSARPLFPHSGA